MKLFWLIIMVFALAAGAMVWAQNRVDQPGFAAQPSVAARPAPEERSGMSAPAQEMKSDANDRAKPHDADRAFASTMSKFESADPEELQRELVEDLLDDAPRSATATRDAPPGHDHQEIQQSENPWAEGERKALEHSIEKRDDGAVLIDGLFTMRGEGTPSAPYEITWDYLMSAAETYQPRLGMTEMPERITMLDGKHIRIAGFLMFPMASFEADEALVMLNMWDGCCIGTMPSPYDAIEVQFSKGIPSSVRQFATYGTVQGKLVVDPYLISDWLIGLYVLEDATLDAGM